MCMVKFIFGKGSVGSPYLYLGIFMQLKVESFLSGGLAGSNYIVALSLIN